MSKRRKTLGFFSFSKEITHRGKRVKIEPPEDVHDKSKNVECSICKKKFFNTQGLGVHKLICSQDHPEYATAEINKHDAPSRSREKAESVVEKVQSVVNYLVETVSIGDPGKEVKDKKKATRGGQIIIKSTVLSSKLKLFIRCNPMHLRTKSRRNMESVSHSSQNG